MIHLTSTLLLIIGLLMLILGILYGRWTYFIKQPPKENDFYWKKLDVQDKVIPIILIICGIIMILKNY